MIGADLGSLVRQNVIPCGVTIRQQMSRWTKLPLSWYGRTAMMKMKILPKLLFLFNNLVLNISMEILQDIQRLINNFIWNSKRPRINLSLLCQKVKDGGVALPMVLFYYYAARLSNMVQWWHPRTRMYWEVEQLGIPLSLSEWALLLQQSAIKSTGFSETCMAITKVWQKVYKILIPGQSLVGSVLSYPGFQVVKQNSDM